MEATQITAHISPETHERLERYLRARGLKKGFVVEQALLHHLQALSELPEDLVVPPRLVLDRVSGERVLDRLEAKEGPSAGMADLFREDADAGSD